jgi:pimeloyl-ACP methyl ester carboxylesterase
VILRHLILKLRLSAAALALAAVAVFPLTGCSGARATVTDDWLRIQSPDRADRVFLELGIAPRILHIDDTVLRFIDVRGSASVGSSGDGYPWIFVHGQGGSVGDFGEVLVDAAAHHRVLAFDLPGYGASFRDSRVLDYSVDRFVDDLVGFGRRAGVGSAHLVCHSMGGQICLGAALSGGRFVRSLTLIDTAGAYRKEAFIRDTARRRAGLKLWRLGTGQGRSITDVLSGDKEIIRRFVSRKPQMLAAFDSFMRTFHDRLGEVHAPTLIVWGRRDPVFPVEHAFHLKENIDGAALRIVDGAGHCPQLTHPEKVTRWIEEHHRKVRYR